MPKRKVDKIENEESASEFEEFHNSLAQSAFNTDIHELARPMLDQTIKTLWDGSDASALIHISGTISLLLKNFKPRNSQERMLVAQMVSTHMHAMNCLQLANSPKQTTAGVEMYFKHAEKLMNLYLRQVEALDKHRGKGKQRITVEHVNVHAGGQAIVGDVSATKAGTTPTAAQRQQAGSITDESAVSDDGEKLRDTLSAKRVPTKKHVGK